MKGALAAASTMCLIMIAFNSCVPIKAAKEETDEDLLSRAGTSSSTGSSSYDMPAPIPEEFTTFLGPDDLISLCSSLNTFYEHLSKRNFNPWGGKKRFSFREVDKKNQFNPWGGKRNSPNFFLSRTIKTEFPENKKPVFNPWGGR